MMNGLCVKKKTCSGAVFLFSFPTEKELWDNNLTAEANMAKMGLRQSANSGIRRAAVNAATKATPGGKLARGCEVARLFGEF